MGFVEGILHRSHQQGSHLTPRNFIIPFIVALIVFLLISPQQTLNNFQLLVFLSPLWVPYMLFLGVRDNFVQMNRAAFFAKQEYVLLELRMPRDTTKTPFAMETFFANMHIGSGETTWYKKYFQGGVRPWWSLELVSLGGRVHFYLWTRTGYRRLVESFLYAQYPDIEIIEAEDYSRLVDPSEHGYGMFACEFNLTNPNNAVPIKTYKSYEIEPGDKPEETVDPLAQLIETMASIGPGEQFWIQYIIRMTKEEKYVGRKNPKGAPYTWRDEVSEAVEAIRAGTVRKTKRVDPVTGAVTEIDSFPNPTKGESEQIAAIQNKASKQIFDVGIRSVYLASDDSFNGIMIPAQLNMFKPFNSQTGNSIGPTSTWSAMFNDFPWEDRGGHHKHHYNHEAIKVYRRREFFYEPSYKGAWSNLSTEELATLYHVPSAAITTPNLPRIQSATSGAPANLPS